MVLGSEPLFSNRGFDGETEPTMLTPFQDL